MMKKRLIRAAAFALLGLFLLPVAANAETELKVNRMNAPESFLAAHPEVNVEENYRYYKTTSEITTEMLLGTFESDVFEVNGMTMDYRSMMEKGYFLDLSGSEIIREAVQRLYPAYAEQCMVDGKIYAVPVNFSLELDLMNPKLLGETGLGEVEMPDTFPEFLDFVEEWLNYLKDNPENIALYADMDESVYKEKTYVAYLVNMLLESHIQQKSFAGEPLRFNEPEVVALLKRSYELGKELYQYDLCEKVREIENVGHSYRNIVKNGDGKYGLGTASAGSDYVYLCPRLNENQPKLLPVYLDLVAVNARTENPELCVELIEAIVSNNDLSDEDLQYTRSFLYKDAELVPSKSHDRNIATSQRFLQEVQNALANENLDAVERYELEEQLKIREERLQAAIDYEEDKWVVTPGTLERYRSFEDYFYISMPGVFSNPNEIDQANTFKQLKRRFIDGQMTAEQLVTELDRVAQMIEKERE